MHHSIQRYAVIFLLLAIMLAVPATEANAQTDLPVVRAVLFYSPTCGHCQMVIKETILPLAEKYGDQLQIIGIDVTEQQGQAYFLAAMQTFELEQAGVPFLVIDDLYMVGSEDIPQKLPGLVEDYLAQGGLDWPTIPGLTELLKENEKAAEPATASSSVVRAVLFHRSTCSHCVKITQEVIPPLQEEYGSRLEIFSVDVSQPEGDAVYNAAIDTFQIEQLGVPILIIGDQVLVGGGQIEEQIAGIMEGYLDRGGVDWPEIPGLQELIAKESEPAGAPQSPSEPAGASEIPLPHDARIHWTDRLAQDPAGNSLAVLVLVGMLGAVAWVGRFLMAKNPRDVAQRPGWIIPLLCIIGLAVAGYLAYVETTAVEAVCGPVGDCNTVQQSEYARLFGILPIGVLGLIGYAAILISWLAATYPRRRISDVAAVAVFAMTALGTLFSIYLTFLEPFVIGATCAWCLTSAIIMTGLMLLSVGSARSVLVRIHYLSQ